MMTMTKHILPAFAIVLMLLASGASTRAAINNADYPTQIQAADVLSRFLTDLSNRADARAQAMTAFLRATGASREYMQQKKPFEHPQQEDFERVFAGAVQF